MQNIQEQNSLKAIAKMVRGISQSAVKLNEAIAATAVLCIEHAQNYGDVNNTAVRLCEALPMTHRRNLLIEWFAAFSPITIAKKGNVLKGHLAGKAEDRVWNIEGARATPFYTFNQDRINQEPDMPTYESLHSNVVAFVSRLEKVIDGTPKKAPGEAGYKPRMPDGPDRDKAVAELNALKRVIGPQNIAA
jgi:hypothetical protein